MNVLIAGLGSIAQKHIHSIRKIYPNAIIYALRSSKDSQETEGIINLFSLQGTSEISFHFAIISNPTYKHKETIEQLMKLDCPLFIEKPLYNHMDIESTANKFQENGIFTYVGCNLRFLDCIMFLKDHISKESPQINEVNSYCGSYLPEWRKGKDFKTSYSSKPALGGGVHLDLIHELDYIFWFFGQPNAVRKTLKNNSYLKIEAIDYANYLLDYDRFCVNITLNYFRRDPKRYCEIVFENYTWYVDLLTNKITCNNKIVFESSQTIQDTYDIQMKYFIENLDNEDSMNNIQEAFGVLKLCIGDDV